MTIVPADNRRAGNPITTGFRNQGTGLKERLQLISAMSKARTEPFRGVVKRGEVIDDKAYTNFARVVEQLGYSTFHYQQSFGFDLAPMFAIEGLHVPVRQLLELKIRAARWDGKGDLTDELVAQKFHDALAITADQFRHWLKDGRLSAPVELEDATFFSGASGQPTGGSFSFKSGHSPKKTGAVGVAASSADRTANLRHNEIQTELYGQLVAKFGEGKVGTEVSTGDGTSIDVVVDVGTSCWFYEIKIADSLRACVRQSIPQLLEYAYWSCDDKRAEKLIIVSEFAPTVAAEKYLAYLRSRFGLPIYYEQHMGV